MNRTLRARLLLAISATILCVLCITQYGQYLLIRQHLYDEFDQNLGARVRSLTVLIEQKDDRIDVEFQHHQMQEFARSIRPEYYQVWHADGTVLARSRQLGDRDLKLLTGDMVAPAVRDVVLPDGRPGRAAGIRFRVRQEGEVVPVPFIKESKLDDDDDIGDRDEFDYSDRISVTLVIARDTLDLDASLNMLMWLLIGAGAVASGVILGMLAWLVSRNLRPLQVLARQISMINEQSLNQRFNLSGAPGELQPVVSRLNALMSRLESAFLREKTFTADVAHELRTPLAGIRSTLEVGLSRVREPDNYRRSMERCLRISQETEKIVGTLLMLSRIEAGQAVPDCDLLDVTTVLRETWLLFQPRAREKNVDVVWVGDEPIVLDADRDMFRVAISNLFDNATSYVEPGGRIRISSGSLRDQLVLTISNTGCQLSSEQLDHVFDRFWRGDSARTETGSHAGLGLALTRRIIESLGGVIDVRVSDGQFVATVRLAGANVVESELTLTTIG